MQKTRRGRGAWRKTRNRREVGRIRSVKSFPRRFSRKKTVCWDANESWLLERKKLHTSTSKEVRKYIRRARSLLWPEKFTGRYFSWPIIERASSRGTRADASMDFYSSENCFGIQRPCCICTRSRIRSRSPERELAEARRYLAGFLDRRFSGLFHLVVAERSTALPIESEVFRATAKFVVYSEGRYIFFSNPCLILDLT